jgi:multisubunit Na+/H+ antiporter MnhE subunit
VADDRRSLYVHLLDAPDIPERVAGIKALYERWIVQLEGEETTS